MNKMKQSEGININAVITALGATQNQDNSRRRASREQKENPHYTCWCILPERPTCRGLSPVFGRVCRRTRGAAAHSSLSPRPPEQPAKIWLNYVFVRDVMKFIFPRSAVFLCPGVKV